MSMRMLVACPRCGRQYDAGDRAPDSRFRCLCGAAVTVRLPKSRDAAVVRCSSCGSPRTAGQDACGHCGSDFTLHEKDLDTVCPQCFARISDRAKFCHHCGTEIKPEAPAGQPTDLHCPVCGKLARLSNRRIGPVATMECQRCAGFWLGANVLEDLVAKAASGVLADDWQPSARRAGDELEPIDKDGPRYRKCPVCAKLMHRRNYGRHSGVIIDVCREHGVWFDVEELPQILEWVRAGGRAAAARREAEEIARRDKMSEIARRVSRRAAMAKYASENSEPPNVIVTLAKLAARFLIR
jgi:Zn-finger nucleic acid-binding protein